MTSTAIDQEMLRYFNRLNKKEQKSIVSLIKTFAGNREDFIPQTLEEYNDELERADADIEAGNFMTHEEVMKRVSK